MSNEQVYDKYAFILDECRCSSSQEEFLAHCKFAREDETFSHEPVPSSSSVEDSRMKLDSGEEVNSKRGGKVVDGEAGNTGNENLGFQGERKRMNCEEEREIETQLEKTRVFPMVNCSGKAAIEVKIGSMSRSPAGVVDGGSDCTKKLDSEGFEDEIREESGVMKKKVVICADTEVGNLEDEEEIESGRSVQKGNVDKEECQAHGEASRKVEGDEEEGGGLCSRGDEEEHATRRGKRKRPLPPSIFGVEDGHENGNGDLEGGLKEISRDGNGNGNGDLEGGLKEINGDGSGNGNGNGYGDLKGGLKEMSGDGNGNGNGDLKGGLKEISRDGNGNGNKNRDLKGVMKKIEFDFFETAKRCGLKFPRSRFLQKV